MRANELKVGMRVQVCGINRTISLIFDYSPDRILIFTVDNCQHTFLPEQNVEVVN